jgi:hypothetical protein
MSDQESDEEVPEFTEEELLDFRRMYNEMRRQREDPTLKVGTKTMGCKPERYDGSRKPPAVENWIKSFDDYLELNPSQ